MKRYISRQIVGLFLVSLIGLVLFTSLTLAVQLSDLILTRSESFSTVFKLLALKVPEFLGFALPIGLVVSTFIILARLINDREILAFQLGGYSLKRIAFPIILIGILVSLAGFGVNNYLVPWANLEYREEIYRITKDSPLPRIQSDLFFKDPSGRMIYVGQYDEGEESIEDIIIFDSEGLDLPGLQSPGDYPEMLSSQSGTLTDEGWVLSAGQVVGLAESGGVSYSMKFDELRVSVDNAIENLVFGSRKPNEMGVRELRRNAIAADRAGKAAAKLEFAFHSRFSQPLAALVFVLFSVSLSLLLRHQSRAVGILLALVSVGGYQGVLLWAKSSARQGVMEPALGAWLPDLIFGALGLILFLLLDKAGFRSIKTRLNPKSRD
ncbi:LptF/LptG family permease [Candidatus Bipolaricaulota bacterium]|nr:LptF/LptG family permease [Candidatus Bipolaricaulota bacterium]